MQLHESHAVGKHGKIYAHCIGTQGKQLAPEEDIRYVIIICALGFLVILLVVAFTAWRIRRNILKKKRCFLLNVSTKHVLNPTLGNRKT